MLSNYHAYAILTASKTTSKKKRKIAKNHSEGIAKKFKVVGENMDTSTEEPRASGAISVGTASGKSVPFEARNIVDNSSSIPSTTLS